MEEKGNMERRSGTNRRQRERRNGEDRRKVNMTVAVDRREKTGDRRKGDRRKE